MATNMLLEGCALIYVHKVWGWNFPSTGYQEPCHEGTYHFAVSSLAHGAPGVSTIPLSRKARIECQ